MAGGGVGWPAHGGNSSTSLRPVPVGLTGGPQLLPFRGVREPSMGLLGSGEGGRGARGSDLCSGAATGPGAGHRPGREYHQRYATRAAFRVRVILCNTDGECLVEVMARIC